MPSGEEAVAVRVQEGKGGWEDIVVVYHVGEIGHRFFALVHWSGKSCSVMDGGIDSVNCCLPTVKSLISESTLR